jgi:peptide/nickel transport system permease protein
MVHITVLPVRIIKPFINIFKINTRFRVGFIILMSLVLLSLFSLVSPPFYKEWYKLPKDLPPSCCDLTYILGTTSNGRSVFWVLVNSIRNSLIIALITALIAPQIGLLIGIIAGTRGGITDKTLMFLADMFITIPSLPLYIILTMMLKNILNIALLGILIAIPAWAWPARQTRAMILSLREREFIMTATLSGMNTIKIIFEEILPHVSGWQLIAITNTIIYAIASETGLAFLGLVPLSEDTLGLMIYWVQHYNAIYRGVIWWYLAPTITLILLFVSLYLISIGITYHISRQKA